ncbi:RNA polymerase sigma-70 factor [Agromyces protaetiae]|uniref:RNA polymerase sigma-70 factor n=1 Tax=Agromyces protaetiae TaxID=2509455 RepID=A0A4P6FPW7_9MICO|nr:RNA polymerase sigma-70 factor [Agromyces protaetiae]QAY72558.1 RNA polymerase sigma-70 factor [Agromyces protaetiae]
MRTHQKPPADWPHPRQPLRAWRGHEASETSVAREPGGDRLADALATFDAVRPRLFGIAYRMLGSVADAEDLVQDVWIRWQNCDRDEVREPAAFLATTATRLAINALTSARARRETYIGPWLPEPVDTGANPELAAEHDEAIELAVLFLMEKLTPMERAAYVLREAFGYPYDRIAEIIDASEQNARQLVSRARKHLADERRAPVEASGQRAFLEAFLVAAQSGDLATLETLLADNIVSYSDGGGIAQAARIALVGRDRVVKFVLAVSEWFWEGIDVRWVEANDRSALLLSAFGEPFALFTVSASEDGIDRLFWMMNPVKLGAVLPVDA